MKKNTRSLIIVGACVLVLGGAAAALTLLPAAPAAQGASSSPEEEATLISKTVADLKTLHIESEGDSYTLSPTAKPTEVSGATAAYTYQVPELSGIEMNETAAAGVAAAGYRLKAEKSLGKVASLGEYGLEKPAATVTATYQDGGIYAYLVGNETPAGDYYVSPQGTGLVYTAALPSEITAGAKALVSTTLLTAPETPELTRLELTGKSFPEKLVLEATKEAGGYAITAPKKVEAGPQAVSSLVDALKSLTAISVAALHPTAGQLEEYGLDKPAATVNFTMNGETKSLSVSIAKANNRYLTLAGTDAVFVVTDEAVQVWANATVWNLQYKTIFLTNIVDVANLKLTVEGDQIFNIESIRTAVEPSASAAADAPTEYTYTATLQGKAVQDYETYRDLYKAIISLSVIEPTVAITAPNAAPYYEVAYHYYDDLKRNPDFIAFYPVENGRCLAVLNGAPMGLVPTGEVQQAMALIGAVK